MDWIERIPYKRTLFVLFALTVFFATVSEIVVEIADGEPLIDMIDDILMLLVSGFIVAIFFCERILQTRALHQLQGQLDNARGQLSRVDVNSQKLASQYREIMQRQFDVWSLTKSEQEVVISLLKGLSFREVSELRQTREKTVRQQATSVYKKAGVAGRHELAAWFFEDLLDPPASEQSQPSQPAVK